jgi:PhzF family phenazine biosynthesis protein
MPQQITQVDAFTPTPFSGNPAGVCVLPQQADAEWMQHVACEMNVAETAFLYRQEDGFNLRWFTPVAEVDLCGHATLASAHILWEDGHLRPDEQARFHTRSGLLTAIRRDTWIEMDFPATPAEPVPTADLPADLLPALGVEPLFVGKSTFDYLVEVDSDAVLRALKPDRLRLERVPARGVIITARAASPDHDFIKTPG